MGREPAGADGAESPPKEPVGLFLRAIGVGLSGFFVAIPFVFGHDGSGREQGWLWGSGAALLMVVLSWIAARRGSASRMGTALLLTLYSLPVPASPIFFLYVEYAWIAYGLVAAIFWLVPFATARPDDKMIAVPRTTENPWGLRPRTDDDPPET